ncbi:MAG: DUF5947 family protein [Thermoanaerobaculia bacterium]
MASLGDSRTLGILQRFVKRKSDGEERCELCSAMLRGGHQHLWEVSKRQAACACDACAILFSDQSGARYRRIPRGSRSLPAFAMADEHWAALNIPVDVAFFYKDTAAERTIAMYPSPAGATESTLTFEAWTEIERDNPVLGKMELDVEALLVRRGRGGDHQYYLVPIDECYRLVGIIRIGWRGLSGGSEVWSEIDRFFADLKQRSRPARKEAANA